MRDQQWQLKLSNYFDRVEFDQFKWGSQDCALFVAGAVEAMTGEDVAAKFRGQYQDARGAAKVLRELGAGTLKQTVTSIFGEPKHVARAHRGDVVMYDGSLGICCGRYSKFIGSLDDTGNLDNTAALTFADAEDGLLGDDQAEPALSTSTVFIPILTASCDLAWSVAF